MAGPRACGVSPTIGRDAGLREACYRIHGNVPERTRRGLVYTVDPSLSRAVGGASEIEFPYERSRPGPVGRLFAVDALDFATAQTRGRVDLDRPGHASLDQGDPDTHCRMVYATAMATYETFRRALGRPVAWSFWTDERSPPLSLAPFAFGGLNAWYDRGGQRVQFGYAPFGETSGRADSNLLRFTALSSDVVAHEVTHALLDGLRPGYDMPVHPDVLAFHEALADIVALLTRFERTAYLGVLLREAGRKLIGGPTLTSLAPELGGSRRKLGLRTLDVTWPSQGDGAPRPPLYAEAPDEPHSRGNLLSSAVFEAFLGVLDRRIEPLLRLAGPADGSVERYLQAQVEDIAGKTAGHFLAICVRALDYCPPAAIRFSDYLRALITADRILVRSDRFGYRDEIIEAFRRRGIYPADINVVSEGELAWGAPECPVYPIPGLALSELRFDRSPAIPLDAREIRRQAKALALAVEDDPRLFRELGLRPPGDEGLGLPEVVSIRPTVRTGPDGYIDLSVIAEIAQERRVMVDGGELILRGGGTLILDATGTPAYVVRQRIDNADRRKEELAFARKAIGRRTLINEDGVYRLGDAARQALC